MKKEAKLDLVNKLLNELNSTLVNKDAKNFVFITYSVINKPEKISMRVKEIPDALDELDRNFIALSQNDYHFSDESMKVYRQLRKLALSKFGHGWGGLIAAKLW